MKYPPKYFLLLACSLWHKTAGEATPVSTVLDIEVAHWTSLSSPVMSHLEICAVWVGAGLHVSAQQAALLVPVQSLAVLVVDAGWERLPVHDPYIVLVTALYQAPGPDQTESLNNISMASSWHLRHLRTKLG